MITYSGGSGSRQDVNKIFDIQRSGAVYTSFLVNVLSAGLEHDYFISYRQDTTSSYLRGRVFVKTDSLGNLNIGLSKGSTSNITWSTTLYSFNTIYLMVLKYVFVPGDENDILQLFINPDLSGPEPVAPDLETFDINNDIGVDMICPRQGSKEYTVQFDGLRIATAWELAPLPVELTSFAASAFGNSVKLRWSTATELNNKGFAVQRKIDSQYMEIGFVDGNGTTTDAHEYVFVDNGLESGKYLYRLKQFDYDGTFEFSNEVEVEITTPANFSLEQNYPNPFNPSTRINFSLAVESKVSLKLYNLLGQEVAALINSELAEGQHSFVLNAGNLSSGVYMYQLRANGTDGSVYSSSKKMILSK